MDAHAHILLQVDAAERKAREDVAAGRGFSLAGLTGLGRTRYCRVWEELTGESYRTDGTRRD